MNWTNLKGCNQKGCNPEGMQLGQPEFGLQYKFTGGWVLDHIRIQQTQPKLCLSWGFGLSLAIITPITLEIAVFAMVNDGHKEEQIQQSQVPLVL